MIIKNIKIHNFRNISDIYFDADESVNIIFGENGQGKTNILEGIWLFTGCNSFRTRKNAELIKKGEEEAENEINFEAFSLKKNVNFKINKAKEIRINGIKKDSYRSLLGEFQAVVFTPSFLNAVDGAPGEKRKFLDIAISLLKPNYAAALSKYNRAIIQRNALLKKINEKKCGEDLLFAFDEEAARAGGKILAYRLEYIEKLKEFSAGVYEEISGGKEKMSLEYLSSVKEISLDAAQNSQLLYDSFLKGRSRDIQRVITSSGPHKDDLDIKLDSLSAKVYASQGQKRTCALSIKISEGYILKEIMKETPAALLDDVMSELDDSRQKYLLKFLRDWQVFITCCDKSHMQKIKGGRLLTVREGKLV